MRGTTRKEAAVSGKAWILHSIFFLLYEYGTLPHMVSFLSSSCSSLLPFSIATERGCGPLLRRPIAGVGPRQLATSFWVPSKEPSILTPYVCGSIWEAEQLQNKVDDEFGRCVYPQIGQAGGV